MKTPEKLNVKMQAEILGIGQILTEMRCHRPPSRTPCGSPEAWASEVDRVLKLVRASPARKLLGIQRNYMDSDDVLRLKAVAYVGWQMIAETNVALCVEDVSRVVADGKNLLAEQLPLIRDFLGRLIGDGVLLFRRSDFQTWTGGLLLPERTFSWMTGGVRSKGDFDPRKLDSAHMRRLFHQGYDGEVATPKSVPSVRELFERTRQEVVGLDPQVKMLASRIGLHVARAEMLKAGQDCQQVGQMVVVLVGSSGAGKSFLVSRLAAHCGLAFVQYDSTVLTSQGYVGADLDEPYRLMVNSIGGDAQEASRGIVFLDEFDKKSTRYGRDVCTVAIQQELLGRLQAMAPFVVGGKRQYDSRPLLFDGRLTGYFLGGVFPGLNEILKKIAGGRGIGFASEAGCRRHGIIQDALKEFGYLDELINRVGCVITLPDPTLSSLERATAGAIQDAYARLLIRRGIVLCLSDAAVRRIARYGAESKTYYRGCKQVLAAIAEELLYDAKPTAYIIEGADVRRAIERLSTGIVQPDESGHCGQSASAPENELVSNDADSDTDTETSGAGG